jgi:NAD-dependent SIR2 family protein deacetylase
MTRTCQHCDTRLRTKHRQAADTPLCHDCTDTDGTAKHPSSEQYSEDADDQSDEEAYEDADAPKSALVKKTPDGWQPVSST